MTEQVIAALHELIAVTRGKQADAWIPLRAVAEYIGFSIDRTEELVARPDFPHPARVDGTGQRRWLRSDVGAWMRTQQVSH